MSSVKRRINSTGRKRIGRECVEISMLDTGPDEPLRAKIQLDLKKIDFPSGAQISIEAYHRSSSMRFDCGTVLQPKVPDFLVLSEIDRGATVLFRLKVVDNQIEPGKLLGAAERLRPKDEAEIDGRRSLFPIVYKDLQSDVWRVSIEPGSRPVLVVNKRIPGFSHKLVGSPLMQGLLLPAALRFVLSELVTQSDTGEDSDEVGWKDEWLEYCQNELEADGDPREFVEEEDKANWIDAVVTRFAANADFISRIKLAEEM